MSGQSKCWGHSCHSGCPLTAKECRFSDSKIKADGQHWTLEWEFNLRGGHKDRPAVPIDQIDGRNRKLRQQAEASAKKSREDGGSRLVG